MESDRSLRSSRCRLPGAWRLFKKRVRQAWRISGDDNLFNQAILRVIRVTAFIEVIFLLIHFAWHILEVAWRYVFA